MRRQDAISRLREVEPSLRALGVEALYLFGSHARDEARPESDVDVFVDPAPGRPFGLRPYMGALAAIEGALGARVDYGTRSGLHPRLRGAIEREAIRVF